MPSIETILKSAQAEIKPVLIYVSNRETPFFGNVTLVDSGMASMVAERKNNPTLASTDSILYVPLHTIVGVALEKTT